MGGHKNYGLLWTKRANIASGGVVALELGSKTEEKRGEDEGDKQDRHKGRDKLRKGGRILGAIS